MDARSIDGFSLVELLMGMVAASVLALIIAIVVGYSYGGWMRMRAMAELQRDAAIAMRGIAIELRPVSNDVATVVGRFVKTGDKLQYTRADGTGMDLVQANLVAFSVTPASNRVDVALVLREPKSQMSIGMTNYITLRNYRP